MKHQTTAGTRGLHGRERKALSNMQETRQHASLHQASRVENKFFVVIRQVEAKSKNCTAFIIGLNEDRDNHSRQGMLS